MPHAAMPMPPRSYDHHVIRIDLDEPSLDRTRIATSPLWETVASLHLLARNPDRAPWPYTSWARGARKVLSDEAVRPVDVLTADAGMPDFFCPPPPLVNPTIGEELAALQAIDPSVVRDQLAAHYPDRLPPSFVPFRDNPRDALRNLAGGLAAYWDGALAPHWPAMRAALEEEVLLRARALAADGPGALLSDLHERVQWQAPTLTLVKGYEHTFAARSRRLALIPLLFSRGALICSTDDPEVVAVSYQARGAVVLADGPDPRGRAGADIGRTDRLAALLGPGRATVLRALILPGTTAGLAVQLGLAASTVSEHLTGLHAAGVVYRSRVGRRVLYGLEPAGVTLLNLLDPIQTGHEVERAAS
jgi:DNA-binding transcriptional ArsR family regulator